MAEQPITQGMIKKTSLAIAFLIGYGVATSNITAAVNNSAVLTSEVSYDEDEIKQVAENYLNASTFSKEGLALTLAEYEHFDLEATKRCIEEMDVDWQRQADEEVDVYLHMDGNSEECIRGYLLRDHFTEEEIDNAIAAADADWAEQAAIKADIYLAAGVSRRKLPDQLKAYGFNDGDIDKALSIQNE